jgi:hypothetical protein
MLLPKTINRSTHRQHNDNTPPSSPCALLPNFAPSAMDRVSHPAISSRGTAIVGNSGRGGIVGDTYISQPLCNTFCANCQGWGEPVAPRLHRDAPGPACCWRSQCPRVCDERSGVNARSCNGEPDDAAAASRPAPAAEAADAEADPDADEDDDRCAGRKASPVTVAGVSLAATSCHP